MSARNSKEDNSDERFSSSEEIKMQKKIQKYLTSWLYARSPHIDTGMSTLHSIEGSSVGG
jgi:hypothetical protein